MTLQDNQNEKRLKKLIKTHQLVFLLIITVVFGVFKLGSPSKTHQNLAYGILYRSVEHLSAGLAPIVDRDTSLQGYIVPGIWAAGIMYVLVGFSHFAKRDKLEAMIPESWPYRRALNYISGAVEMVLGAALLFDSTRYGAAMGLIILMILVFPVNISVAYHKANSYNISRLFYQPIYILWLYWFAIRQDAG